MEEFFDVIECNQTPGFAVLKPKLNASSETDEFTTDEGDFSPLLYLSYLQELIYTQLRTNNLFNKAGFEIIEFDQTHASTMACYPFQLLYSSRDFELSLDIVPAIPLPYKWMPMHMKLPATLVKYITPETPLCLLLGKTKERSVESRKLRISTSFLETQFIMDMPNYMKAAYVKLKYLFLVRESQVVCPTYLLKTALFFEASKALALRQKSPPLDKNFALNVYRRLKLCIERKYMYSFSVPGNHIIDPDKRLELPFISNHVFFYCLAGN